MTSIFRTTALAALVALSASGVFASTISLNFDSLGVDNSSNGVPVAGPFTDQDVTVSGGFAYAPLMLDPGQDVAPAVGTSSGFIANQNRDPLGTPQPITISLGTGLIGNDLFFKSITLRVFSPGAIRIGWSIGIESKSIQLYSGQGVTEWASATVPTDVNLPWLQSDRVSSVSLFADTAVFGIDNLTIALTGDIPSRVPEPGSYALVGLALLAAGAASRRRA